MNGMKKFPVVFLFAFLAISASLAAKNLIDYAKETATERRVRETTEEEFNPAESRFLKVEQRVKETAEEEFDLFKSEVLASEKIFVRQIQ